MQRYGIAQRRACIALGVADLVYDCVICGDIGCILKKAYLPCPAPYYEIKSEIGITKPKLVKGPTSLKYSARSFYPMAHH